MATKAKNKETGPAPRPTSWWLCVLRKTEKQAAIARFNAAFRAEENVAATAL